MHPEHAKGAEQDQGAPRLPTPATHNQQVAVLSLLWAPICSISTYYLKNGGATIFYLTVIIAQNLIYSAEQNGYSHGQAMVVAFLAAYSTGLMKHMLEILTHNTQHDTQTRPPRDTTRYQRLVAAATFANRVELVRRSLDSVFHTSLWAIMELFHRWLQSMTHANETMHMMTTAAIIIVMYHCVSLKMHPKQDVPSP